MSFTAKSVSLQSLLPLAALTCFISAGAVAADADYGLSSNGTVALTSDYVFRGLSQTNRDIAVQGGVNLEHTSGLMMGFWGSNVRGYGNAHMEFDLSAGYKHKISDSLSASLSVLYYAYPMQGEFNTVEVPLALSYGDFSLGYAYSPDWSGTGKMQGYVSAGWKRSKLLQNFGIGANVGFSHFGKDSPYVAYGDAKGSLFYEVGSFTLDLSGTVVTKRQGGVEGRDPRGIFTITKSF